MNGDTVKKVPASSVPFGESICERGNGFVWAVYDYEGRLVGVFPTAKAARRARSIWPQRTEQQKRDESERRYHPGGRENERKKGE